MGKGLLYLYLGVLIARAREERDSEVSLGVLIAKRK
jgi:hypothetical protein